MNMSGRWIVCAALLLLPARTMAQTAVDEKMQSRTASERIVAARKAASVVTAQQCQADLSSWEAKDDADDRAKVESPNFWYEILSTEELVRLYAESASCGSALRHAHRREDASMMPYYGRMFNSELLFRAENVLTEHYLMQEYLLKSSETK
jgi:hypothetical protein